MRVSGSIQAIKRWHFTAEGQTADAHLAYAGHQCAVADRRGNIYYLDDGAQILWRENVGNRVVGVRLTTDGKAVFVLTGGELIRFNWKGKVLWRTTLPAPGTALDVRSASQTVAVGCGDLGQIYAGSGRLVAQFRVRHGINSLRVASATGGIAVSSDRGHITYVSREGEPQWEAALNVWSTRVDQDAKGNIVLLPGGTDGVFSFDSLGAPRGIYDIGGAVRAAAVDDLGQRVLVDGFDNLVRLLDASDGRTLWTAEQPSESVSVDLDPTGDRGIVIGTERVELYDFVTGGEERGEFLEVRADTGPRTVEPEVVWKVNLRAGHPSPAPVFAQIAVRTHGSAAAVLEPEHRQIRVFDHRGTQLWRQQTPMGTGGDGHARMQAAAHGNLIAVGAEGGLMLATFDEGPVQSMRVNVRTLSVADAGNAVLAGDAYGRLHLYDAEAEENWSAPTDGFVDAQLCPRGDAVGICRADGMVRYYKRSGERGWQVDLTPGPNAQLGHSEIRIATLDDGVAFIVHDGRLGVMDPHGQVRWEKRLSERPIGVQRVGRLLAVTDRRDQVHLFRLDGQPVRTLPTRDGVSLLTEGGVERTLEFHYNDREINCFDVDDGIPLWRKVMPERVNAVARSGCGAYLLVLAGTHLVNLRLSSAAANKEDPQEAARKPQGNAPCFLEL